LASARGWSPLAWWAVEQWAHLRILAHEHLVEMRDQRFAARFQQGTVDLTMASWASVSMLGLSGGVDMPVVRSTLYITRAVPCWYPYKSMTYADVESYDRVIMTLI
jgi:hypothetical protein